MLDIYKDCTRLVIQKLCSTFLRAESLFNLLIFILSNFRFSVNFSKKLCNLIDDFGARDNKFTPSPSGNEEKGEKNEVS